MTSRRIPGRRPSSGFTLVELLAVILIISILAAFVVPKVFEYVEGAKVTACEANMRELHKGMMLFKTKFKKAPNQSGVKFFVELIESGTWENSASTSRRMTCPAVEISFLAIGDLPESEWYSDFDVVDGDYSAYAGRDCRNHPLRKFPGSGREALVADDNDGGMNHESSTVVLYADGNVQTLELYDLRRAGVIAEDEALLLVGPDSPVEELRKLSLD